MRKADRLYYIDSIKGRLHYVLLHIIYLIPLDTMNANGLERFIYMEIC